MNFRRTFASTCLGLVLAACGADSQAPSAETTRASAEELAASCTPCLADTDCGSGVCAQFDGDMFCALKCSAGSRCASGSTCEPAVTSAGVTARACLPKASTCGGSGVAPPPPTPNGPPHLPTKGGGIIGSTGGTMPSLYFAVVGDTRPPVVNDTSGYPTTIIQTIYSDIAALSPAPAFVVGTGDYMFASATGADAQPQINMYLAARGRFSGTFFPALGNHECTGATASNCGPGGKDGETENYKAFLSSLLAPIGKTQPYYSIDLAATDASWTAKIVFVAANAWDSTQESWFDTAMSKPTTYTFVVRHEAKTTTGAPPGVAGSEAIMAKYPYTLAIVGHTHTYKRNSTREVVFGNGGAPITGGVNYGFGLVTQRADGAIQVDAIDYQSKQADASFRFALKADGSPAS
jgi:hypothetical protein